jgi:hypothetical protein
MIPALAAVAALAVTSSAFAGHTAIELYQYFGDPVVGNVGDPVPGAPTNGSPLANPDITVPGGAAVWLPIYMELRAGNGRPTLASVGFQVYANGTAPLTNTANTSVTPFSADGSTTLAAPGDGTAHPAGGLGTMLRDTQFHAKTSAAGDPGNATFFLGWMCVTVGNVPGAWTDLYFSVSNNSNLTYSFTTTSATINSLAFGADPGNAAEADGINDGLNGWRLQNTNLDVGVGTGLMSTLADATIHVEIPEPATIGLLGLGLLAIRRRRA